jgi:hypothetical protein
MEENEISHKAIGAAIEIHRILGPGLFRINLRRSIML